MKMYLVMFYNGEWNPYVDTYAAIGVFSTNFLASMHGIDYCTSQKQCFPDCSYDVKEVTLDEGWFP